jgi:hypothetical protein
MGTYTKTHQKKGAKAFEFLKAAKAHRRKLKKISNASRRRNSDK